MKSDYLKKVKYAGSFIDFIHYGTKKPRFHQSLRKMMGTREDVVEEAAKRIKEYKPYRRKGQKSKFSGKFQINGVDVLQYLKTKKEKDRYYGLLKHRTDYNPYDLLLKVIGGQYIYYKGKPFSSYFDSEKECERARTRIERGWDIERAIRLRKVKMTFQEAGRLGFEKVANSKGIDCALRVIRNKL